MPQSLGELLTSTSFIPHGSCMAWDPALVWTLVVSNSLIGLAYFSIPFALMTFVRRQQGMQFKVIFLMFSAFIFACGATHFFHVLTIWHPLYRLDAVVTSATAGISVAAAVFLWLMLPQVRAFLNKNRADREQLVEVNGRLSESLDRLRAQGAELAEGAKRLQLIVSNAPIGMATLNLGGRFMSVNAALCTMLGYSESELLSRTFQDITHPDDLEADLAHVRRLLDGDADSYRMEKRYLHKDGRTIVIQLDAVLLRDGSGAPGHFIAQIQDITQRRASLEARDELSLRHTLALRAGAIGVWDWNVRTGAISWDSQMYDLYGIPKDEPVTYRTWRSAVHPDDFEAAEAVLTATVQDRAASLNHFRITRRSDGSLRHMAAAEDVIKDAAGAVVRVIGTNRDVTDHVVSTRRITEAEALQRSIFEDSPEAILVVGHDGLVQSANEQASVVFGYGKQDLLGKPVDDLLPARYRHAHAALRTSYAAAPRRRPMGKGGELFGQRAGGEEFPVDVMLNSLPGSSGSVIVTVRDATESKRREQIIAASLEEKEVLLREVYHRVKNNLQVITSLFHLQIRTLPPGPARTSLGEGADRVRVMSLLHEKLYRSQDLSSIDMRDYLVDLCRRLASAAGADQRGIRLVCDLDQNSIGMDRIGMDTALPVGLIVNELVTNCLKHAYPPGRGGVIHLWASSDPDTRTMKLTVQDDGVGLPEGFATDSLKSLGVKLIEGLTTQLSGRLELSSPLRGTSATVTFPIPEPSSAEPGPIAGMRPTTSPSDTRITRGPA